jgi:group I intron endonuclease
MIGIYQIRNLINNKIYIGSAVDINQRWGVHLHQLKNGIHHSSHLQRSWIKNGEQNFILEILEEIDNVNNLLIREQFYFDTIKPWNRFIGYNICKVAGSTLGIKFTDEAKNNISIGRKGKLCGTENPNYGKRGKNSIWYNKKHSNYTKTLMSKSADGRKKSVLQLSLDGILLKQYPSVAEAIRELKNKSIIPIKRKQCSIISAISACCKNENKSLYGFKWKYNV